MNRPRVIPALLLKGKGLVKTVQFKNPVYLGDPLNTINIFNKKMVDEIILMDISASNESTEINFELIRRISSICFSPLTYGGGIKNENDAERLFRIGIEKLSINTAAFSNPSLINSLAKRYGSQSIAVSINVKKDMFGRYEIVNNKLTSVVSHSMFYEKIKSFEDLGAGEILVYDVNRDGTMKGFDISLFEKISSGLGIPVIACGGAKDFNDISKLFSETGISAAACGSMFVFNGPHKAVLISYPDRKALKELTDE